MRKHCILLGLMMVLAICKGQMTLEATYPSSSVNAGKRFLLTQIEAMQYKYLVVEPTASQFKLYNLNHSLYMTVNIPVPFSSSLNNYNVCFVTKSLFDCDTSNIEYAIMNLGDGSPTYPTPYFAVYRSTGTLLQKIDSCRFLNYGSGLVYGPYMNPVPIINTTAGAKLILTHVNGSVKVYGLCSLLPTNISNINSNPFLDNLPYPNPTSSKINLPYKLADGETGFIFIYDISGKKIKEYLVDSNFESLSPEIADFSSGEYFYSLKTNSGESKAKKFIVAK